VEKTDNCKDSMSPKRVETIVLEPFTSIVSFDAISYRSYTTVGGAIGHYLYPKREEYNANKRKFFASVIGRRNKQKISELVSEVYSYLNAKISEHADPRDYYFRLSMRIEINRKTGEILGHPHFDIDVFRYIGKIGGKHSNIGQYSMKVIFIGKERMPISSIFIKGISKAKQQTGVIDFSPYESYSRAPKEIRAKITKDSPYLIIDEEVHKIEPKIDSKTRDFFSSIKEDGNVIEFRVKEDVLLYILKKVKIKPDIIGSETGFRFIDKEIEKISLELEETVTETKTDLVSLLGVEQIMEKLFKKLDGLTSFELTQDLERRKKRHRTILEKVKKDFTGLKIDFEVQEEELEKLEKDRLKKTIDEDKCRSLRVKGITALKMIKSEMIELQRELKDETVKEIEQFVKIARKEGKKKDVSDK